MDWHILFYFVDSPYVSSEKEFHYSENVSKADNGKYECSAENSLGIKNDFINVDILCKFFLFYI